MLGENAYNNIEAAVNIAGMAIASAPQTNAYPSTRRSRPENIREQMMLEAAQKNPRHGEILTIKMKDPRMPSWMGWQKYSMSSEGYNNKQIHYVGNKFIPIFFDFKFK